ncbi:MAG: beta-glucosidase [Deltaproteobacteria bacterium]|nr:beta-glucosidase [Deltaproteobacteria bacterium]
MARLFIFILLSSLFFCPSPARADAPLASAGKSVEQDRKLVDKLEHDCFLYAWEYSFAASGLARERTNYYPEGPGAVGGTGFCAAAIVAGTERGWVTRDQAVKRLLKLTGFLLDKTDRKKLHGAFPHWINGDTGETLPFGDDDAGADLVETGFLMQGLLIARAYFNGQNAEETELRRRITTLWEDVDWNWFTNGQKALYWHWDPEKGFRMGMKITGFNEALIVYVLALSSPTHPISPEALEGWYNPEDYQTRHYYGYDIEGSVIYSGPLFHAHYSFIGLDPREISDAYVPHGYWVRNVTQSLINRAYCVFFSPKGQKYHEGFWGLTSSETKERYLYSSPVYESSTVAPTAPLSSIPYVPEYAMRFLWDLRTHHANVWSLYGPRDAYSLRDRWSSIEYIAIDQLPIICMTENYRSGLLWKLFMGIKEIQNGLKRGNFTPPALVDGFPRMVVTMSRDSTDSNKIPDACDLRRHPDTGRYSVAFACTEDGRVSFTLTDSTGKKLDAQTLTVRKGHHVLAFPASLAPAPAEIRTLTMKTPSSTHAIPLRFN